MPPSNEREPLKLPKRICERVSALCLALPEVTVRVGEEVRELVTESYRILAPKKLIALLDHE